MVILSRSVIGFDKQFAIMELLVDITYKADVFSPLGDLRGHRLRMTLSMVHAQQRRSHDALGGAIQRLGACQEWVILSADHRVRVSPDHRAKCPLAFVFCCR